MVFYWRPLWHFLAWNLLSIKYLGLNICYKKASLVALVKQFQSVFLLQQNHFHESFVRCWIQHLLGWILQLQTDLCESLGLLIETHNLVNLFCPFQSLKSWYGMVRYLWCSISLNQKQSSHGKLTVRSKVHRCDLHVQQFSRNQCDLWLLLVLKWAKIDPSPGNTHSVIADHERFKFKISCYICNFPKFKG